MKCCCCEPEDGTSRSGVAVTTGGTKNLKQPCCDCCCKKCLPYDDGFMLAAQILSIVAFLVSWLWYVTLIIGIVAMTLLQVTWCCRIKKAGLIIAIFISGLATVGCIVAIVIMIVQWKGNRYCHVWTMNDDYMDDDIYVRGDYCNEAAWAVVAFVTGALWAAATICILYFLTSGRYQKCEAEYDCRFQETNQGNGGQDSNNIELGCMVPIPAAVPYLPPGRENRGEIAVPAASFVVSDDAYIATKE